MKNIKTSVRSISKKITLHENLVGWGFVMPAFCGFLVFFLAPIVLGMFFSFTDASGLSIQTASFTGLSNYKKMFSDKYIITSLKNNFLYAALFTPLTLVAALFFATILNRVTYGRKFFRMSFFLPYITSMVSVAVVWKLIFNPVNGPVNTMLTSMGINNVPKWLLSSDWALFTIVIISVWKYFGYYMLILLAGIQMIPEDLYEAASIDGANGLYKYVRITLPMLSPTIFLCVIMLIINSFQVFDLVNILTEGGPGMATNVLVYRIYIEGFSHANIGYASAISYFLFLIILVITLIQFFAQKYWVHY
ncbi:multiple sugar transport system permease protein [Hungatella effluvii]|uniref:Multiple sugar transport system permease protein n=1 Tax=Hungatella effluvii TaxID=1096246 RepID=A0A2V3XY35_9FIRM|nr:sugar ABC transporter permease [Hungatella effluvii]PXX49219.1 multiple sugar transport system permease protein [Hungatella effluvii]